MTSTVTSTNVFPTSGSDQQQHQNASTKLTKNGNHSWPWFHGKISRDEAERLLRPSDSTDGLFLVRESTNFPGDYTLCVCFQSKVIIDYFKGFCDEIHFYEFWVWWCAFLSYFDPYFEAVLYHFYGRFISPSLRPWLDISEILLYQFVIEFSHGPLK